MQLGDQLATKLYEPGDQLATKMYEPGAQLATKLNILEARWAWAAQIDDLLATKEYSLVTSFPSSYSSGQIGGHLAPKQSICWVLTKGYISLGWQPMQFYIAAFLSSTLNWMRGCLGWIHTKFALDG